MKTKEQIQSRIQALHTELINLRTDMTTTNREEYFQIAKCKRSTIDVLNWVLNA